MIYFNDHFGYRRTNLSFTQYLLLFHFSRTITGAGNNKLQRPKRMEKKKSLWR